MSLNSDEPKVNDSFHSNFLLQISNYNLLLIENIQNLWNCPELEFTRWGTVKTDFQTHLTNLSNVYAIGDISRGASLVVWAIRDGQEAAYEIVNKLKNKTTRVAE